MSKPNAIQIYTDGCFNKQIQLIGSASIVYDDEKHPTILLENQSDPVLCQFSQISGEIKAVENAISWAVRHNYQQVDIYFDYNGLENWANGSWQAYNDCAKDYIKHIKAFRQDIDVNFHKVKGHSNNPYNNLADHMAKMAAHVEFDFPEDTVVLLEQIHFVK